MVFQADTHLYAVHLRACARGCFGLQAFNLSLKPGYPVQFMDGSRNYPSRCPRWSARLVFALTKIAFIQKAYVPDVILDVTQPSPLARAVGTQNSKPQTLSQQGMSPQKL